MGAAVLLPWNGVNPRFAVEYLHSKPDKCRLCATAVKYPWIGTVHMRKTHVPMLLHLSWCIADTCSFF